ncbi:hypothetical protein [Micromonospora sp. NBRC 101691]|uniref:hypothetical protein n=1 Tax=Micromonospora sp. NBRC 101691 TaxID=3032198 RepID=UPI002556A872|nr:hypothetical protein [Micromonospora sp. NBRC 101691]
MTKEQLPGGGTVFGIGRRKSQAQLAKAELNQGVGHLMQAATYASRGVGHTVGPRVQAARVAVAPTAVRVRDSATRGWGSTVATLAPLAVAARGGAAQAGTMARKAKPKNMRMIKQKKKARRRSGMMTGLLAAGAVAGIAGAMAMRRRRDQQEWAEYDPNRTLEPMRDEVETIEVRTPTADRPTTTAAGPTGAGSSAVAGAGKAATTKPVTPNDKVPSVAEGARDVSGRPADDVSRAMGNTASPSGGRH